MRPRVLAGLALVAAAGALAASSVPAQATTRNFRIEWEPTFAGLGPRGGDAIDEFVSTGGPFGRTRIRTVTPASQRVDSLKTPTFRGTNRRGTFRGRLRGIKTYLSTTRTRQVSRFVGTGVFEGGTGAYRNIRGRITRVSGIVTCTRVGCDGPLTLVGSVTF